MLKIIPIFLFITLIDFKELKKSKKEKKLISIYCTFIILSFIISAILYYDIKTPTPADVISGFLRMLKVIP
jgi:hypothetical protein